MSQITTVFAAAISGLEAEQVWNTERAYAHLNQCGQADSKRTAERRLNGCGLLPTELSDVLLRDEKDRRLNTLVLAWALEQARKRRDRVLFAQLSPLPTGKPCLHANDARGARFWVPLATLDLPALRNAFAALQQNIGKPLAIFPHGALVGLLHDAGDMPEIRFCPQAYLPVMSAGIELPRFGTPAVRPLGELSAHLKRLEAESIHILREAVAEARNPAMLYSSGKDSGVLLHLARKAFYPSQPPFPLLHVDTGWDFQEMYLFRDLMMRESGMEMLVHSNAQAIEKQINPFDHGGGLFTDITATQALCQALEKHKFDMVLGGARRDEQKSRAKERIFSSRSATHHWAPKSQRPELWGLYNTRQQQNASMRVFPLSNWTELDIWHYIYLERIPVVPLYFSKPRAVVVRPEMIRVVNDGRCRLLPGEQIQIRNVRFRSLGCYPLSGAIDSEATSIEDVLMELVNTHQPERQGRLDDTDSAGSMEKRKREGYF